MGSHTRKATRDEAKLVEKDKDPKKAETERGLSWLYGYDADEYVAALLG